MWFGRREESLKFAPSFCVWEPPPSGVVGLSLFFSFVTFYVFGIFIFHWPSSVFLLSHKKKSTSMK